MKSKRLIAALLMAVIIFSAIPFSAFAADWGEGDTLEDALSELKVGFDDKLLDWLVLPSLGVINLRYTYFIFENERTGTKDQHPVYCIDPTKGGAIDIVAAIGPNSDGSKTATYIRGEKVGDAKYRGILAAGHPHMMYASLGLESREEGYYATKLALWMYIRGNDPSKLTINPKYGNNDPVALRVRKAAVSIYTSGTNGNYSYTPELKLTGKSGSTAELDSIGNYYVHEIEVYASGWIGTNTSSCGDVNLSWESTPPVGTLLLGSSGEDITSTLAVTMKGQDGKLGWYGKITIKYPAATVDHDTFTPPTLKATAIVPNDEIYMAYAKVNKDKYQRYLVERDPKIKLTDIFISPIRLDPGIEFPSDTTLRIRKVQSGTNTPLSGAVFEVKDPDGKVIYSGATSDAGVIDLPLAVVGNYTVTEKIPPQYHLPAEIQTQSITVKYNEVAEVTFANEPYGALRVVKRDASNGAPLSGASVRIRNITTNTTQERITDSSGSAYFDRLPVGAYEIAEIIAPAGFALDSGIHTVNVVPLSQGETSYTLTNKANPGLRIIKFDRQKMIPLANATFEVWKDGELYGTYLTDAWGEIELHNLPAGTYTAREVAAPESYVIDPTAQWIEIKAGQGYLSELVFFNLEKPGIRLIKVDSETLVPLLGARFEISKVGGTFKNEYVTGTNGEIDLSLLEPGAYVVKEIAAPNKYLIDDSSRVVQINAGESAQFIFANTKKPGMEIVKYDPAADQYLGGATFGISKVEDGSHYLDRVTDINGKIRIDDLEPGIYSAQEVAAPSGYVLDGREFHIELFPGQISRLVVTNEKKPDLQIVKTDAITNKPIQGVTFTVKKADSSIITTVTTGPDGTVTIERLEPGVYQIIEQSVPDGYLIDKTPQLITLVPNRIGVVQFKNYPKPAITINKVDSITRDPIKGAKFSIIYASNNTFTGEVNDLGTHFTDEKGQITLDGLTDGWLKITEMEPAAGYSIKGPASQIVFIKAGEQKSVTFENVPLSALIIRKIDADTSMPVQGAAFRVRYLSGISGSGGTIIYEGVTSGNGTIVLTGLKAGTYVAEEYRAAPGYELLNPSEKTAYISGKEQDVVELEFSNAKKGQVLIQKLDSVTKQPLKGAQFKVTDSSGSVIGPNNGIYTTDASGLINLSEYLPVGSTVVVQEIKAPNGYVLDTNAQTIKIKENTTHTFTFYNTPGGGLQIIKLDEETRQPISGVSFEISSMNGERIGTYHTDSRGIISLPLEAGWYTAIERSVKEPYKLDATPHNIEVRDGKTATLEITNRKQSGIMIHKVDASTGAGIYGVTFVLYDAGKNPIDQLTTDQYGYAYANGELTAGTYFLRELEPADGYIADTQYKTVHVKAGTTTTVEWKNTAITGQIQITKYASEYNSVTGDAAGTKLKGAVFEVVRYKSGAVVGYITTDARGVAATKPLPLGRYIIREVTAPPYYQLSGETFDVDLEFEGQVLRLAAYNKPAELGVSITKTGIKGVLAGSSMSYTIKVANTSNVALESFYWHDRIPTDACVATALTTGTYSQRLNYRVLYKTNYNDYRVLASNLLTTNNYSFAISALPLMAGEVVTDIYYDFGTVPAGFQSKVSPTLAVAVGPKVSNGYYVINRADVGGKYQGTWETTNTSWITIVRNLTPGTITPLPKTGY